MSDKPQVTIYTDGGCSPNPGPGGWAYLLIDEANSRRKEGSGNASGTTNNRMELTAAIEALRALKRPCLVTLHTDSKYLQNGTGWMQGWIKNGWKTSKKKPVKNRDLWEQLQVEIQKHTVHWCWVEGHSGNKYNERVDQLVAEARDALPQS